MTISDIIDNNELNLENLEGMNHIPKSELNDINIMYNDINSKLEELIDTYGDEPENGEDDSEDNW